MSLGVCPLDCEPCDDPECYVSGCRQVEAAVLFACEACGELHVAFMEPPICRRCWFEMEVRLQREAR